MTETLDPIKDNNRRGYMTGIFLAILAAALYALNAPLSKLLLEYLPPTLTAGFLYIGAGAGMGAVALIRKARGTVNTESKLTKAELPYTVAMVVLDIAAPILLMFGLSHIFMDTQLLIIAFLRIRTLDKLFEATIALVNFRICN